MRKIRMTAIALLASALLVHGASVRGQVVINEIVEDERQADSTDTTDNREFIELYNAGSTPANIGNYTMHYYLLGTTANPVGSYFASHDTIPAGTILAPHTYWVIGADSVPNVNQPLGSNIDLFPNLNTIFELRTGPNTTDPLVDALALDTFRTPELGAATQEQLNQIAPGQTVSPTARGGVWGQTISNDAIAPNVPNSIGRYLDGRDSNDNGRDFGYLPVTPGASNNLPQNAVHTIPNVDAMNIGDVLGTQYYASFKLPRVIDPQVVDSAGLDGGPVALNPKVIPRSPQGGKAIVAFDETGGGNAVYSKEYVNKFDLYAYVDTSALNTNQATVQSEATIYGIGTTDPFFGTPDPSGRLGFTSSANGSTGIGWLIQRVEAPNNGGTTTLLQLIDMNNGGDSAQPVGDWQVKQTIDLSAVASGWHRLSITYNPSTGAVSAVYDNQTFNLGAQGDFNGDGKVDAADYVTWRDTNGSAADYALWKANFGATGGGLPAGLVGNFYVGYRENLPGDSGVGRPPTYDMIGGPGLGAGANVPEPCAGALAAIGMICAGLARRRFS
jgi:hypothetical protein